MCASFSWWREGVICVFDSKRTEQHDGGSRCTILIDGGDGRDLLLGIIYPDDVSCDICACHRLASHMVLRPEDSSLKLRSI